jgi:hypothetical protein
MKYEKNDALDQLIEAAIAEIPDKEGEEFESIDDSKEEIEDRVDREVEKLLSDQSKKITGIKYRQRILSSAALVALVTVCIVWMAIMNTFGSLPNFSIESSETSTERTPSHSSQNPSQNTSSSAIETITPIKNRFNPTDEKRAIHTVSASCTDGLTIEVTLHGYQTQSLHKAFYVKNDEYFAVDVKITNTSENPVYQYLPTNCRESNTPHNHEIDVDLYLDNYTLCTSSFGFACTETPNVWTLEPGKSYEWSLKLAAGEVSDFQFDLPADGYEQLTGIKLYEDALYDYGPLVFSGNIVFYYQKNNESNRNDCALLVPLSIEVINITEK